MKIHQGSSLFLVTRVIKDQECKTFFNSMESQTFSQPMYLESWQLVNLKKKFLWGEFFETHTYCVFFFFSSAHLLCSDQWVYMGKVRWIMTVEVCFTANFNTRQAIGNEWVKVKGEDRTRLISLFNKVQGLFTANSNKIVTFVIMTPKSSRPYYANYYLKGCNNGIAMLKKEK